MGGSTFFYGVTTFLRIFPFFYWGRALSVRGQPVLNLILVQKKVFRKGPYVFTARVLGSNYQCNHENNLVFGTNFILDREKERSIVRAKLSAHSLRPSSI